MLGSENVTVHQPQHSLRNAGELYTQRGGDDDNEEEDEDLYDECVVVTNTDHIFHPIGTGNTNTISSNNNMNSSSNLNLLASIPVTRTHSTSSLRIANFDRFLSPLTTSSIVTYFSFATLFLMLFEIY